MGATRDVLHGIAQILATNTGWTYNASGFYADDQTGIVIGTVPQSPPSVVALIPYPLSDDPTLSDSVMGLQIRYRTGGQDPRDVADMADAGFDALQNHPGATLGSVRLLIAERTTGTPLGEDSNGRPEWADSYQLSLWRPSPHRV